MFLAILGFYMNAPIWVDGANMDSKINLISNDTH
jgi:hypothetical protein